MTKVLRDVKLDVEPEKVLKRLMKRGFGQESSRNKLEQKVLSLLQQLPVLIDPTIIYQDCIVTGVSESSTELGSGIIFKSKFLAKYMSNSDKATVYIVTIGNALETEIQACEGVESLRSLILDAIGSESAETLADKFSEFTKQRAKTEGARSITLRCSPGYGDWGLEAQETLFEILKPEMIGVSLTESHIMIPEKTTSGVIGWIY